MRFRRRSFSRGRRSFGRRRVFRPARRRSLRSGIRVGYRM